MNELPEYDRLDCLYLDADGEQQAGILRVDDDAKRVGLFGADGVAVLKDE